MQFCHELRSVEKKVPSASKTGAPIRFKPPAPKDSSHTVDEIFTRPMLRCNILDTIREYL